LGWGWVVWSTPPARLCLPRGTTPAWRQERSEQGQDCDLEMFFVIMIDGFFSVVRHKRRSRAGIGFNKFNFIYQAPSVSIP